MDNLNDHVTMTMASKTNPAATAAIRRNNQDSESVNASNKFITHSTSNDDGPRYGEMKFEDLFHNPLTQTTAWQLLHQEINKCLDDTPSPVRKKHNRKKVKHAHCSCDVRRRINQMDGKMTLRPRLNSHETKNMQKFVSQTHFRGLDDPDTSAEAVDDTILCTNPGFNEGSAMVNELFARYEVSKKGTRKKPKDYVEVQNDSDSSELEELSDDDFLPQQSDFMKFSIPQYDIKKKLYELHCRTIENLNKKDVMDICKLVLPEVRKILNEELPSKRHEIFKTCIGTKQRLWELNVAQPFTDAHDRCIMSAINEMVGSSINQDLTDNCGELLHYISLVLLPETLIRIFSKANKIDYELAEKELLYKSSYDGNLDAEVIRSLQEQGGSENYFN